MENGGKKIIGYKLYSCGFCKNNLGLVFKHQKLESRSFPALVVCLEHREFGHILYDTGYSKEIYENHIVSFLYNLLNKTYIDDEHTIRTQLQRDGIASGDIRQIILSHAHPDHIGGLKLFQDYQLLATEQVVKTLLTGNAFKLVFRNMIPERGIDYICLQPCRKETCLHEFFDECYDVLDDGSMIGVLLSGHAEGQMGIYLPEHKVLFGADACWGTDLISRTKDMRLIARWVQDDYCEYRNTVNRLTAFRKKHPEVTIVYSHSLM